MNYITLKKPTLNDLIATEFINRRVKANRPVTAVVWGESGSGKSVFAYYFAKLVKQAVNSNCDVFKHFVYTPSDFKAVFAHVAACNMPIIIAQETTSFAPSWIPFFKRNNPNLLIYNMLVMSREIKPLIFLICAQNFLDLFNKIRQRTDFIFKIKRYVTAEGKTAKIVVKPYFITEKGLLPVNVKVNDILVRNVFFYMPQLSDEELAQFRFFDRKKKQEFLAQLMRQYG